MAVAAGCSGDDGVEVTEATDGADETVASTTTPIVDDPSAGAEAYMRAFSTNDPTEMQAMIRQSEPGSPARAYAIHQQASVAAFPQQDPPDTVSVNEDTIDLEATPNEGEPYTTTYGDFEVDPDSGRLVSFSVNGESLDGRIVVGGQPVSSNGVTVTPVSAYRTVTGDVLNVNVEVANGTDGPFSAGAGNSSYVNADGSQVQTTYWGGPNDVQAGANAAFSIDFERSDLGGTLFYSGFLDDFRTEASFQVPFPTS
jgi:hypothetical protein